MEHNPYAPPKSIEIQKNKNIYPVKKVIVSINIATFILMYCLLLKVRFEKITHHFLANDFVNLFIGIITIALMDFLILCLPNSFTCFLIAFKKYDRNIKNIIKLFFACSLFTSLSSLLFFLFIEMIVYEKFTSFDSFLSSNISLIIASSIGYGFMFSLVAIFCLPKSFKE